jgi:hypothetical protein
MHISHMKQIDLKLSEIRVPLTMPAEELKALDAYCAKQRRKTGDEVPRAGVIRQAIRKLIESAP